MMKELFEYQKEDVEKLKDQTGILIGSEMGTGKTIEALELIRDRLIDGKKHLIITPMSTFNGWESAIEDQLSTPYYTIEPKDRNKFVAFATLAKRGIFICHYQSVRLMPDLEKIKFDTIILDECHRISNRDSAQTKAIKRLKSDRKIAMSGTATGDKPWNLWSVLNWIRPNEFKSYWAFANEYVAQSVSFAGYRQMLGGRNIRLLHKKISPYFVRHLKREKCCEHHPRGVNEFLPDKTYSKVVVDLSPTQSRLYKQMSTDMVAWVGKQQDSPLVASIVIAKLFRLSQIALATPEFNSEDKIILKSPSTKINAIKEILADNENEKFVIYTNYKAMVDLISDELNASGINTIKFTGELDPIQRKHAINQFNSNSDINVLIATIKSIGTGVDGLQNNCSNVIFTDRSLTADENKQAEDRLHRIGQKDNVNVIDIVAKGTIEEDWLALIDAKWTKIKDILGDYL